jgi:hypothetical protein
VVDTSLHKERRAQSESVKEAAPLPDYVAALQVQMPPRSCGEYTIPGVWSPFDVTCLTWDNVEERGKHCKVAAIPASAEVQFLEGESMCGASKVNCWCTGKGSANTLKDRHLQVWQAHWQPEEGQAGGF